MSKPSCVIEIDGWQTNLILTQEGLFTFTKVYFTYHQQSWWFFHAFSAANKKSTGLVTGRFYLFAKDQ